ncbi:phytanoyl-CoA dioxygenase family protein [Paenibacillus glycanilyticus]|uniref:SnoK protein n=1 Tax=Paenibacillus glycanilyticus TaxID=126569 RepID=A0ABQ6GKM1_9BACL|nr:phytanoyl-CoA dioxygenase family protein [Paenibacillus glycanilyticus]GLX71262.1 SnoK protein [Paenibacillus glycanilyticus]
MLDNLKTITDEQVQYYRENGFVQIDNMLSEEELEELRSYLDETMMVQDGRSTQTAASGDLYYRVLNQRVNTWRDHGGMARFVLSRRFAEAARQLTGANGIRLFHDHALLKMPQDSKATPWHQDFPYWPMNESGALSIWIALDDVDENNGCMMMVPKSQKIKNLKTIDLVDPKDIFADDGAKEVDRNTAAVVRMKAGSCTFHDGLTFHYAHANNTDKPRRALAIIYMPDGTTFNGANHLCTDGSGFLKGQVIAGGLFPRLA